MAGFWGQSLVNDWEAFEPSGFGRDRAQIAWFQVLLQVPCHESVQSDLSRFVQ
jgi:hypothetical protein